MKLSVIIANHNYRDFVGAAIESALAVDWPDKEVIAVDDASTDDSRNVIEGVRGRVAAYFRPKSHQLGAHMFGFERSTGDIIIFLDADDLLEPEVMQEVAKIWRPGVSKVQYRMNLIDATGTQLGSALPQLPAKDNPEKLRGTHIRTMAYNLPRSGKACSQDFVCDVLHSVRRATNAVCLGATSHQIRPPLGLHSGATGASIWSGCRGRALASARWARCCDSRRCRSEQGSIRLARYRGVSWCSNLPL